MRSSFWTLLLALITLTTPGPAAGPAVKPAGAGLDTARLQMIRQRLQELVDRSAIPGAVALVARHGEIAFFDAVGWRDLEGRKPMQRDTIFQIMSMTKNFTGVAAMMLVEEGKLDLAQPVELYLPEFRGIQVEETRPDGSKVRRAPVKPPTVWQLMSHTSGLRENPGGAMSDLLHTLRAPLAEAVRFDSTEPLIYEPGTRWSYSNVGIATLGRIVEVLSGQEYTAFVRSRILEPLGMKDTFFFPPDEKRDRIAMVYDNVKGKLVRVGPTVLAGDPARYRSGAKYPAPEFGLYSTASDLLKFYQMLLGGGSYQGKRYLSRQAIRTMTRVFTPPVQPSGWLGGTGYGLTFEIVDKPEGTLLLHSPGSFGHGGAFGTEGWIDPTNDMIRILLVQVAEGSADAARAAVMQIPEAAIIE